MTAGAWIAGDDDDGYLCGLGLGGEGWHTVKAGRRDVNISCSQNLLYC
jgi:hypothetical protein